ncbi:MAG: lamin tail domain-containing protein [Chloroflexi bacterium]|nr:lamin tail domain-containing protein [Chloroflexota bacterium]
MRQTNHERQTDARAFRYRSLIGFLGFVGLILGLTLYQNHMANAVPSRGHLASPLERPQSSFVGHFLKQQQAYPPATVTPTATPTATATPTDTPTVTPTATPTATSAASILISEVLYDPPAGCTEPGAEWVELYNAGSSAITLTNWQLCDASGCDTIPTSTIQPSQGLVIAGAQADFLGCYTCGSGHVVYVADGAIGDGLGNDGDRVRLLDNNGIEIDAMSYGADTYAFTPACPDVGEGHSLERYPIQQDTNAAGDFRDQSNPSPCQNPTAVGLAGFAVRSSDWRLALLPALVALGLGGLLWSRRMRR